MPETTRYAGFYDATAHRVVYGWVYDAANPTRRLAIEVTVNGRPAGIAVADVFRGDLLEHGIGDGGHGFEFPIPEAVEAVESVEIRVAGTSHPLPNSSPEPVDAALNRPLPDGWRAYPNFFILGAAKSGTTSLHHYLSQCPEILMSEPKEPYFFEAHHHFGATHYFNRYFSQWAGQRAVGEARHRNLYRPEVPARIHAYNPDARLIVILRNPIERAVSHWWHWYSAGREKLSLRSALREDLRRLEGEPLSAEDYVRALYEGREAELRTYLDSGYYMQQMDRYLRLFGKQQLHVILFEELAAHPARVTADTLAFLGLDSNPAARLRYPICNPSSQGMLAHADPETLTWLQAHYAPHNRLLEQYLDRSLAHWDHPFQRE